MKPLSANAAAKLSGKAKGTILAALEDGTLSGSKNAKGHWQIDPAELARVFDFDTTDQSNDRLKKPQLTDQDTMENRLEIERLRAELEAERKLSSTMADQIDDLRMRLDKEGEERRALTAMLTEQITNTPTKRHSAPVKGLFGFSWGRSAAKA